MDTATLIRDRGGAGSDTEPGGVAAVADAGSWPAIAAATAAAIEPASARHDRENTFVADSLAAARDAGLVSMLVPSELGGGGATYAEACAALTALAHGCPATALTLSMHLHLVAAQVWRYHRDLPAPVLGRVAQERILLVSTGASDWVDSNGTSTAVDGGFRVTARKRPASGCPAGDVLVSSVRWDDGPDGPQVVHFAVPFSAEGVSIDPTWDTMGMRGTGSHTVVLDDVFVPEVAVSLVRPAGVWHPVWNVVMGAAMPLIMSVYVGIAEAAAARAVTAAGSPGSMAGASAVGRMLRRLHGAQDSFAAMVAMADDLHFDNDDALAAAVLSRKSIVAEASIDTVRAAVEIVGGSGFSTGADLERWYRDVHGALFHPLPAARQEVFTGRVALGSDPLG